jgi:hypothetical protein
MSKTCKFTIGGEVREEVQTTVVTDEDKLRKELQSLFSVIDKKIDKKVQKKESKFKRLVGLGIEKSFISSTIDRVMSEKVAVLKLYGENHCLIVHLLHFKRIPTSLANFFDLSGITVVGVGIKKSLSDLRRDYGIQCRNAVVELGDLAAAASKNCPRIVTSFCLEDLYKYLCANNSSFKLSCFESGDLFIKSAGVAFSDWGDKELSPDQIYHASMEVYATAKFAIKITEDI